MSDRAIYVIRYEARLHKVGISDSVVTRLAQLRSGEARSLSIVRTWAPVEPERVERQAHALLRPWLEWGERFTVGGDAACAAVEFAIALVADREAPLPFGMPPSVAPEWAAACASCEADGLFGYAREWGEALLFRRAGVPERRIYMDLDAAIKALRAGDTLLCAEPLEPCAAARVAAKGAASHDERRI